MQIQFNQLFPVKTINQKVNVQNIEFLEEDSVRISFEIEGTPFSMIVPKEFVLKNVFSMPNSTSKKVTRKSTRPRKKVDKDGAEIVDESELNIMGNAQTKSTTPPPKTSNVKKRKRRIMCPLKKELIESDLYHANKKAGLYKDIK